MNGHLIKNCMRAYALLRKHYRQWFRHNIVFVLRHNCRITKLVNACRIEQPETCFKSNAREYGLRLHFFFFFVSFSTTDEAIAIEFKLVVLVIFINYYNNDVTFCLRSPSNASKMLKHLKAEVEGRMTQIRHVNLRAIYIDCYQWQLTEVIAFKG